MADSFSVFCVADFDNITDRTVASQEGSNHLQESPGKKAFLLFSLFRLTLVLF